MAGKKVKIGIFHKIVITYIVFAFLTFCVIVLSLLVAALKLGDGNTENLSPYNMIDEQGQVVHDELMKEFGVWVETLDENYHVIDVQGNKLTKQKQYTPKEIVELTKVMNDPERDYLAFIEYNETKKEYYLIMYNSSNIQHNTTLFIENTGENSFSAVDMIIYVMFFGLSALNILLLSLYIRRKIKKPLDALMKGMEQVKQGAENVSLNIKTEAEFQQIVDAFNVMSSKLAQEKAERELLVKKKNQLLMELSHDIKTPIATIKSYSNALEAGLVPEEKKQGYYHTIDKKADRVLNLAEDMFLMLKMDYADYKMQMENIDICELLRKICAEYYDEIEEQGFEFDIEIPEEKCLVCIDIRLFTRVIENLLNNAKKYNATGNHIRFQCFLKENRKIIRVMDDGKKIEKEIADSIFEAFSRGDKSRASDGGTGLGLAIAKAIIEKHGGSIGYQREQQWNVFEVIL